MVNDTVTITINRYGRVNDVQLRLEPHPQ
jgi:hypothetical protein